jgi:hypothetical protein
MRRHITYRVLGCLLLLLVMGSCQDAQKSKGKINWGVSLDHTKSTPYGSAIAYETLPHYFPSARRESLTRWFRYTSIDNRMYASEDSANLLVLLGLDYYITDEEWVSLLKFVKDGNELFLLSSNLDAHLMKALQCGKVSGGRETYPLSEYNDGSASQKALRLLSDTSKAYGYYGRTITSYFEPHEHFDKDTLEDESGERTNVYEQRVLEASIDTTPTILGTAHRRPDFLRYRLGRGHITLHAAPLVLSNYFLLQKGNRAYLDSIWHSFPNNISVVYWNEYYRRTTQSSNLSVLLKYPATRWALIIAALTLLLYVLFGLKRLQRVVPLVPPVENASVSFVETVGRLYFNKGVHANLAEKMIQHFLEWVRTYYYLDTSQLNEAFILQLAAKSGKPEEEVAALIDRIHNVRLGIAVTPEYLYELHRSIQSFYKAH